MFHNYLSAALGNLARNRLYAAVSIGGLALAFATAILIAAFVRDDFSYDRFIPGHAEVYRLSIDLAAPGRAPDPLAVARSDLAAALKLDFPQINAVARLVGDQPILRHGDVEAVQKVYWADPALLQVLPLPLLAGDGRTALAQPDGLVLTRRVARKFFGRDNPIGEALDLERPALRPGDPTGTQRMRVTAVLKDLPDNTHLDAEVFASGGAAFSPLTIFEHLPKSFGPRVYTYLRLSPGASGAALARALPAFGLRHIDPRPLLGGRMTLKLAPLAAIHHLPPAWSDMKPPGSRVAALAIAGVGALILVIAAINFVSLLSARAGQRAVEVGVRKAVGAARRDLMLQFLGEALIQAFVSLVVAVALSELLEPLMARLVGRSLPLDYLHDPFLLLAATAVAAAVGVLAGLYPAVVLSSFKPGRVLKAGPVAVTGGGGLRQALATLQFAILIGLLASTGVLYQQTIFALARGLDRGNDRVLLVSQATDSCKGARDRVRRVEGVAAAVCASNIAVTGGSAPTEVTTATGRSASLEMAEVDFGLFELHGLRPLAGRLLSQDHPLDGVLLSDPGAARQPPLVINATAARRLGFASAAAAVGQSVSWQRYNSAAKGVGDNLFARRPSEIVGVVPDFSMQTVREAVRPMLYYVDPSVLENGYLVVRLSAVDTAGVLHRIAGTGRAAGARRPLVIRFYSQIARTLYADVIQQSAAVAAAAGVAVFIACLGLFGLAAFTAERRTREIGIRKAMGASRADIVRLLLWQFTKPVLWANLAAWPLAWVAMDHWLHGFAIHIALGPWPFLAATVAALVIAWATVLVQTVRIAGAKPIGALRYQ